ncbi:MAG TPA: alpha/beta fold hydrolase [Stellaceae bacterium]|jgi:homoserine O-acetyltransferase|nr:alpha/beta fold hydrolase [Stellaceae bacterium]
MNDAMALRSDDIGTVEDRFFTLRDFRLANGRTMPEATIAYETYGRLAPHGRNAVLVTHGFTGSHHFAGRNPANGNQPGSWDGLIGPGKAIDTDRLFVVASNMLGSSFGSTNAASIDPATGEPYGPDFPAIAIRDIVAAQKALLASLGVEHLVAVAGPSYGGYQAFQWAVAYPDFMDAIVAVNTAPWASANTDKQLAEVTARLAADPEWHGGRYYGRGGAKTALTEIRIETLKRYGIEANLTPRYPDPVEREAAIRAQAANWAQNWDAHSLIILRRALLGFDTRPDFAKIKARVLYILCRTDALFPPKIAPAVIEALGAAGVAARYFELDSDLGHSSAGPEHAKWSPVLREFLMPLVAGAA